MIFPTILLLGFRPYVHTRFSDAKLQVIKKIQELSGYRLRATTLLREEKFNLFFWSPKESETQ